MKYLLEKRTNGGMLNREGKFVMAGYVERYVTLIKTKGDNFLEDSGGLWELDEAKRSVFDREAVEKQLKHMT